LLLPLIVGTFALAPAFAARPAAGANRSPLQEIPITGTIAGGGTFNGSLSIVSFGPNATNDGLLASGLVTGVLRTPSGNQQVNKVLVTDIPVSLGGAAGAARAADAPAAPNATCEILHLSIGPIDLDLLGLVVHVDEINITIDAQSGPGNLLGNLLCAIAGLLDGNPLADVLNQIVGLLNRIIDLLG
jgi:hypothetical protein